MEKATTELSRCIAHLGLRTRDSDPKPGVGSKPIRRTGVMEKVANVFYGHSSAAFHSKLGKFETRSPEKPARFGIRYRNGYSPRAPQSPKLGADVIRSRTRTMSRPTTWSELIVDETFLSRFFLYLPPAERAQLAKVCRRWRTVLYQARLGTPQIMAVIVKCARDPTIGYSYGQFQCILDIYVYSYTFINYSLRVRHSFNSCYGSSARSLIEETS